MVHNGGSEKDYDNPNAEANKDFHPPKFKDEYYCPNKCEGGKIYSEPGSCPVCGTSLMPIKERT